MSTINQFELFQTITKIIFNYNIKEVTIERTIMDHKYNKQLPNQVIGIARPKGNAETEITTFIINNVKTLKTTVSNITSFTFDGPKQKLILYVNTELY